VKGVDEFYSLEWVWLVGFKEHIRTVLIITDI
jgi:hypothetical protein